MSTSVWMDSGQEDGKDEDINIYKTELRVLYVKGYYDVLAAARARGKPTPEFNNLCNELRLKMHISDSCHKMLMSDVTTDPALSLICLKLNGYDYVEEWRMMGQKVCEPLTNCKSELQKVDTKKKKTN